ncbi:hypothetical protein OMCYN_01003 [cyanobiont of Ornithocercus magnificus]|nr:hypothetical protein OMCYN_01003 [cyanobiont of Ornithocercus magnificus]
MIPTVFIGNISFLVLTSWRESGHHILMLLILQLASRSTNSACITAHFHTPLTGLSDSKLRQVAKVEPRLAMEAV